MDGIQPTISGPAISGAPARSGTDQPHQEHTSPAEALRWQGMPLMRRDILGASLAANLFSLALPMLLLQVYDRILPNQAYSTLFLLVMGMGVVLVLDAIIKTARAQLAGWVGARFEHAVGTAGVRRLLEADRQDLERDAPGRQLDRLAGVDLIRDFYASQASIAIVDLPFVILFLALLAFIAGSLVFLPIVLLIVFSAVAVGVGERLHSAIEGRTVWDDRRYNFIIEVLGGIHTIKGLSMEQLFERRYERLMESCAGAGQRVSYLSGVAQGLGSTFSQLTMAAVVGVGSLYVIDGSISVGGLAACTLLAGRVVQPILRALGLWTRFQSIRVAEEKLAELEAFIPHIKLDDQRRDPVEQIELREAYFRYGGVGPHIIKKMSLKVARGEIVGIQGANGSGKTTILQLIMGAIPPEKGGFYINGEDVAVAGLSRWQREIAYLGQRPVLFDGTVMENITMFAEGRELESDLDEALEMARLMGLDKVFAAYPDGFDTKIGARGVSNLPGGIGQQVAIARALLRKPSLILFDEANTALDSTGDALVRNALLELRKTAAIVLVTYRPSLINISDRQYQIQDGTLVAHQDTPPKAKKSTGKATKKAVGKPARKPARKQRKAS